MLYSKIFYRIDSIDEEFTINDFDFVKLSVTLPRDISYSVFILKSKLSVVEVGKFYTSFRAYLTVANHLPVAEGGIAAYGFRVSSISEITQEEYDEQENTEVNINLRIMRKPKDVLHYVSVARVPKINLIGRCVNEEKISFSVSLLSTYKVATSIAELPSICFVDINGTLIPQSRGTYSCGIKVKDFIIRKEVRK